MVILIDSEAIGRDHKIQFDTDKAGCFSSELQLVTTAFEFGYCFTDIFEAERYHKSSGHPAATQPSVRISGRSLEGITVSGIVIISGSFSGGFNKKRFMLLRLISEYSFFQGICLGETKLVPEFQIVGLQCFNF